MKLLISLAILVGLGSLSTWTASTACGQEREARRLVVAAVANWESTLTSHSRLKKWRDEGGLAELGRQIDAGKMADPAAVRRVLTGLDEAFPAGASFFDQLRTASEDWLRHLESTENENTGELTSWDARDDGNSRARARFEAELRSDFETFGRWLQTGADGGTGWRRNLLWDSSRKLVNGEPLSADELDAIEVRWTIAQMHWGTFSFRQRAHAITRAVILRRRAMPEAQAAVRQAAGILLAAPGTHSEQEVDSAIALLDRLDVGSALTVAHHRARSQPHGQLWIGNSNFLGRQRREVDETFRVNDVFAGAWARGTARLQGVLEVQRTEPRVWPGWELTFVGESTSSTTSNAEGASVGASARSTIRGTKRIEWRPVGLVGQPAVANASARVNYSSIAVGGGGRRQDVARSEVYGRRSTAEYETAQAVRSSCIERLDQDADRLLRPFNQLYDRAFIKPVHRQGEFAPRIVTSGQSGGAQWNCWYAPVEGVGLASAPPHATDHDWSLVLHQDMVARHLEAQFPARLVSVQELADKMRSWSGTTPSTDADSSSDETEESPASPEMLWRSHNPIVVQFRDGTLVLQLHVDELRSSQGNIAQSAIGVSYRCEIDDGTLLLTRNAPPVVRLGDNAGPSSGRQQTLKRLLARQFARALPEQFSLQADSLTADSPMSAEVRLACKELKIGDGWLQLAGSCQTPE